ncbi:MAG: aldo/keto reductase [Chitinophagaceae bacterium]|nr:aldo/keto reductase [Chitinophagaceae bacterium]
MRKLNGVNNERQRNNCNLTFNMNENLMDHKTPNTSLYNIPFTASSFNGMPFRSLGKSGLSVSNMGLGAWKFGYPHTGDGSRVDEETAFDIFDRAIDLGVVFWDTANRYNNASGNSERIIGKWFTQNPSQRRNVVLATKMYGCMDGLTPNHCGLSRGNILDSVYASLDRLDTDHIDLLYFHSFDAKVNIEESLVAIEDLVRQDCIRYFGVSNFSVGNLEAFNQAQSGMSVRNKIVAVQNKYDLLSGEAEDYKGVLEYASQKDVSFIAWSPLAKGLLTERYLDISKVGSGDRLFDEKILEEIRNESHIRLLQTLAKLALQSGCTISQLVLAYMLGMPGMGPVIPSSSSVAQLESNAAAAKLVLSEEQKETIREIVKI